MSQACYQGWHERCAGAGEQADADHGAFDPGVVHGPGGLVDHSVPEALYAEARAEFGEAGLLTVLGLIAQYQLISSVLVCFDVPVPRPGAGHDVSDGGSGRPASGRRESRCSQQIC